jgi:hypothetical protein
MTALWHAHRPHNTTLPFHGPAADLRLTRRFGAAPGVGSNILLPAHQPGESHYQMEGFQVNASGFKAKRLSVGSAPGCAV